MLVLVCGSRDWDVPAQIAWDLTDLRAHTTEPITVLHGGARGADQMAGMVARKLGYGVEVMAADWATAGRAAGFIRNKAMIERKPDLVLAYQRNGSKGTQHTIDLAESAGIRVVLRSSP